MYCLLALLPTFFASLHLHSSPLAFTFTFTEQPFLRRWSPMRYPNPFRFPVSLPVSLFISFFLPFPLLLSFFLCFIPPLDTYLEKESSYYGHWRSPVGFASLVRKGLDLTSVSSVPFSPRDLFLLSRRWKQHVPTKR